MPGCVGGMAETSSGESGTSPASTPFSLPAGSGALRQAWRHIVSDGKENPTAEVTYLYEVFAFRLCDKWLKLWSCEGVHETSL
jgi:hypothetical protein